MYSKREFVAFHEAAHAVIADFVGMRVLRVVVGDVPDSGSKVEFDHGAMAAKLPGSRLEQLVLFSCVRVLQAAAGGCAEMRMGRPRAACGWTADMRIFDPLLKAIAATTGRSYDDCWWHLAGCVETLLARREVSTALLRVAAALAGGGELDEASFRKIVGCRETEGCEWLIPELRAFIRTPQFVEHESDPSVLANLPGV